MNITKIKIKNLFGISEVERDGKSIELVGGNGAGKTSVIDAIRYALTNKSNRDYIVRSGETEGEIIIETDNGLMINRKARTTQADYKSIKYNGKEVPSPETFLKDIFTELQLNPVEFLAMDKNKQNAIILDLIQFDWDLNWIKEKFGEIVPDVNYEQNILAVLNDIQSEKGYYYRMRQDFNRDARNKTAFIEEIGNALPVGYSPERWELANLSELYTKIETIRHENEKIEKAKTVVDTFANKVRGFEATKEISLNSLDREVTATRSRLENDIVKLEAQVKGYKQDLENLEINKKSKVEVINKTYEASVAKFEAEVEEAKELASVEKTDLSELIEEATNTEKMKSFINEYKRMVALQTEVEGLNEKSRTLTTKIELARTLPGEILQNAVLPIEKLTVKDGLPLINGLPVSNLSEGEKLDLCIDIAVQKPNSLQIILIDGVEKLTTENREKLYAKCKAKGLQFISSRTTDSDSLTVVEL